MQEFEKATLGAGCFWCVEAIFQRIKGVKSVISGYSGGIVENPTYEEVCSGRTWHAEVVQIIFDPKVISYEEILNVFWNIHDPTSLNGQGPDKGTQYRSIILYHNEEQKRIAEKSKTEVSKKFDKPIVTEIKPLTKFYKAEDYHQDYYNRNRNIPYCRFVIHPKLKKLKLE
ncbi:MAG: peptide-methionine (S)-S-oxide reductase MsrA [Nitrososphaerales archaeon]